MIREALFFGTNVPLALKIISSIAGRTRSRCQFIESQLEFTQISGKALSRSSGLPAATHKGIGLDSLRRPACIVVQM